MRRAILILGLLVIISGCSHEIPNPIDNTEPPALPPTPLNLSISIADEALFLEWGISDTTGIAAYRVYSADSLNGLYSLLDSSLSNSFTATNLHNGFLYFYKVSAVNSSGVEGQLSSAASGVPNLFSVIINDGAEQSASRTVTLTIVAPLGTALMRISNSDDFSLAPWEIFAVTKTWLLTPGNGLKAVYALFRDSDGNITRDTLSDDISLNIQSYYYSLEINGGADLAFSRDVELTFSVPSGTTFMMISNDSAFAGATWEVFQQTKPWHIPSNVAGNRDTVRFYALFRDENNDSVDVQASDAIVLTAADPVVLNPVYQPPDEYQVVSISWSGSQSGDFYAYRILRSRGALPADTLLTTYFDIAQIDYTDNLDLTDLPDDNPITVYYLVRFLSVYDDSSDSGPIGITLVNHQPPLLSLFVSGINYDIDTTTGIANLQATVGWSRSEIPDFDHYILYESVDPDTTTAGQISFIYDQEELTRNVSKNDVDTLEVYYYWVKVFDLGDRESQFSPPDSVYR